MNSKLNYIFTLGALMIVALACNYSATTANLSDVKLGLDKTAAASKSTFDPTDEIFAVSALNNTSSKHKVKFRLLFDGVEGAESGTVAYKLDKDLDIEGSRDFWYTFSVPGVGFAPGKYKVEFVLMDEDGKKEIDRKALGFKVADDVK